MMPVSISIRLSPPLPGEILKMISDLAALFLFKREAISIFSFVNHSSATSGPGNNCPRLSSSLEWPSAFAWEKRASWGGGEERWGWNRCVAVLFSSLGFCLPCQESRGPPRQSVRMSSYIYKRVSVCDAEASGKRRHSLHHIPSWQGMFPWFSL